MITEKAYPASIEKFIQKNTAFYNQNSRHIYSVKLILSDRNSQKHPWSIHFKYELFKDRLLENGESFYPTGEKIDHSLLADAYMFCDFTGNSTIILAERTLPEVLELLRNVKHSFTNNTGYEVKEVDKVTEELNAKKEREERLRMEFFDNDFPFDAWCEEYIKTEINPPRSQYAKFYNEKLMENFVKNYPKEFIGRDLTFLSQQESLEGFRPDLIFKTELNEILIVEIQLYALDRKHLYKSLEYRDLYSLKHNVQNVNVLLICNELPEKYLRILENHKVECLTISKDDFLYSAKRLEPRLEILPDIYKHGALKLTCQSIIKLLETKATNDLGLDAKVFYLYPYLSTIREHQFEYFHHDLSYFTKLGKKYRNLYDHFTKHDGISITTPQETIIESSSLDSLCNSLFSVAKAWLDNMERHSGRIGNYVDLEIILGHRGWCDYCNYEGYIEGRIKTFEPLWSSYGTRYGYDKEKIRRDLSALSLITFYANKYPNYSPINLFESFEIIDGIGQREKRYGQKPEHVNYFEWVTVKISNVNVAMLETFRELLEHFDRIHFDYATGKLYFAKECPFCITTPLSFNAIPKEGLILSSAYYNHIKKVKYTS